MYSAEKEDYFNYSLGKELIVKVGPALQFWYFIVQIYTHL